MPQKGRVWAGLWLVLRDPQGAVSDWMLFPPLSKWGSGFWRCGTDPSWVGPCLRWFLNLRANLFSVAALCGCLRLAIQGWSGWPRHNLLGQAFSFQVSANIFIDGSPKFLNITSFSSKQSCSNWTPLEFEVKSKKKSSEKILWRKPRPPKPHIPLPRSPLSPRKYCGRWYTSSGLLPEGTGGGSALDPGPLGKI